MELKQICGYLPYGLQVEYKGINVELEGFDFVKVIVERMSVPISDIKPILRPLSDLTKEIEHNGEKMLLIDKILESTMVAEFDGAVLSNEDITTEEVYGLEYTIVQKLYKWHFDIHGLIEKGEAIDINTLK